MNNRPLFWAVMCFALGEVLYIIAGRGSKLSTALVVLICVAFFIGKMKCGKWKKTLYVALLGLGFVRAWYAEESYMGNVLFGEGEYAWVGEDYGGYSVFYLEGKNYEYDETGGFLNQQASLMGIGIVDNIAEGGNGYNVTVKLTESKTTYAFIYRDYKVIIYGVDEEFDIGDMVSVDGVINDFVPAGNPGEFNRKNYYKARGIVGYGNGSSVKIDAVHKDEINVGRLTAIWYKLKNELYLLRERFSGVLYEICDEASAGLYAGLLLGDKAGIPDGDMLLYRLSGIAHIFAISGLHIGIVGGLLYKLLRKLGLRFLPAAVFAMVVTILYGIMTGFSFSTIRAVVMLGLALGGEVAGRRYDMLTGMGIALGVLLIGEPYRILDSGLILSFGAVAGVVMSKYIIKLLEKNNKLSQLKKKKTRWIYGIISSCIFSAGISAVTTPLVAYMYFQIPLYSVVLNLIVVPLMTVTVYCGFFGVLMGCISPFLGGIIIFPGTLSLKVYKGICRLFQMLPFDVINTGKPDALELVIYYLVLGVLLVCINPEVISRVRKNIHDRTIKWIPYRKLRAISVWIMVVVTVVGVLGVMLIRFSGKGEEIIFLDVGQGDGVLIKTEKGTNIVIDVGSSSNEGLGEYVAYPALLAEKMGTVDYWFISHFDKDHTSGLEYILSLDVDMGIKIKNLVVSENTSQPDALDSTWLRNVEFSAWNASDAYQEEILGLAREKGINVIYMKQGDYITDGSFTMEALHPSKGFAVEDKNEQSLVLAYKSEHIKVLFTGDIGVEAIDSMLDIGVIKEDYDILKVPHHGSKNSLSMGFLELINSEVAVISCGKNNLYGHPHQEVVEGLEITGIHVYRCDRVGMIRIRVD